MIPVLVVGIQNQGTKNLPPKVTSLHIYRASTSPVRGTEDQPTVLVLTGRPCWFLGRPCWLLGRPCRFRKADRGGSERPTELVADRYIAPQALSIGQLRIDCFGSCSFNFTRRRDTPGWSLGPPVLIVFGLSYLHGRNTVHRDIKGANILVDPNGEIKLADFGMARHISASASMLSFKGSPYWMAPEVVMNTNDYNLPVDIWSLGCTIVEMATSKPPWSQ
ncbi:Mitogen-activated protein kinase kinase kinase 3, partial [Mucuna pruriens]